MSRRYYIYTLILLFAIIALGDRYLPTFQALTFKAKPKTTTSDFFLENMTTTIMQKNGKPDYQVKAARLTHFPDQEIVELNQVEFQLFRASYANWAASAAQGRIENREGIIHLKGDVILQRPATAQFDAIKLSTSELHIYSKKDYVETSAPVTIDSGKNQVTAVGMRLYLENGRMEFLSSARVKYHAPN